MLRAHSILECAFVAVVAKVVAAASPGLPTAVVVAVAPFAMSHCRPMASFAFGAVAVQAGCTYPRHPDPHAFGTAAAVPIVDQPHRCHRVDVCAQPLPSFHVVED